MEFEAPGLRKDLGVVDKESDFATRVRNSWRIAEISESDRCPECVNKAFSEHQRTQA